MSKALGRLAFVLRTTKAGQFVTEPGRQRRSGNLSSDAEQQVEREFRRLGWEAEDTKLVAAVDSEIDRLEHEAVTLRKMRAELFGGGADLWPLTSPDLLRPPIF
jgi:hypothetical protein